MLQVAKLGIYKIIIFTISNLCENMFLYDKFRMKLEDTEYFFLCFLQYFLGKFCNKGGLHNYVCVLASSKSHTLSCYDLRTYNTQGSNICTEV